VKDNRHTKKIVAIALIIIAIMVTSVVVLARDGALFGGKKPNKDCGSWLVEFSSIAEGEKTGFAESRYLPTYTASKVSFHVDFTVPGDSIVYNMQVSNLGNIDAVLESINVIHDAHTDSIKYELIDLKVGDKLGQGESKNFKIKISYVLDAEEASTFSSPISMTLNYIQDN